MDLGRLALTMALRLLFGLAWSGTEVEPVVVAVVVVGGDRYRSLSCSAMGSIESSIRNCNASVGR